MHIEEIEEIKTLKLMPGDALIVRLSRYHNQHSCLELRKQLCNLLETQKICVYAGDEIQFLKVQLQEHLVDQLIDDAIQSDYLEK